jgi:ubiquinone/menaquinone biosynthesis C-methylase UbiE
VPVEREGLESVRVVRSNAHSVELPVDSIDVAFVCDVYHHFEYPKAMLASLRSALRPGGALIVVDFERIPGTTRNWVIEHVRAGKPEFIGEIERAGFELEQEISVEGLSENYMLRFRAP